MNSVSFSESCSFRKMYFNTNLYSTIKKEFFIDLENAIICRVLLSISRINIALNTTSSKKIIKADISYYIIHQNLLLKHAEHYNN